MKSLSFLFLGAVAAQAALPSVGPDYVKPSAPVPSAYRSVEDLGSWKTATPADALTRGQWWTLYSDRTLDGLESRALAANQDLRVSAARVEQARAAAGLARSAYWPQIATNGLFERQRSSTTIDNQFPDQFSTTYQATLDASWEIDLFGRVRRLSESARADVAATAATFESVKLALTAEVASTYFSLRALDEEIAIVKSTVDLRHRELDMVSARLRSGTATELDSARAETELATTEAEISALGNQRSALQNALAVLIGEPASGFALNDDSRDPANRPTVRAASAPFVPPGLPSDLLERRPDIAAAERALASANARIGVAKAAFFPAISLTGTAGFASADIDKLFRADSRIWAIGPSLYLPIFQGGRNRANLERSRAAYDESVAAFRQQVLIAFREVEDALAATRILAEQAGAQDRAVESARRATSMAQTRYDAGYVGYLDVIEAQRTSLATERASAQLAAQRLNASVALIKALGGGWQSPAEVKVAQK